jgi:hypothetical protein
MFFQKEKIGARFNIKQNARRYSTSTWPTLEYGSTIETTEALPIY